VTGKAFTVGKGQLGAVAGASLGLLFRFGTGVLVAGYKPSLKDKQSDAYSLGSVGGKGVAETSVRMRTCSLNLL
jgi:hypothetical protein